MKLLLKDGTKIEGESFGANVSVAGEVVFNTGMVGYVETLTDPSYAGQILVLTYPLVGNYGVPDKKLFESEKIQVAGLVVSEYSEAYSHASAKQSLEAWLKSNNIPAITGVDTRALTKKLREKGVMLGALSANGAKKKFIDPNKENLVAKVSPKRKKIYLPEKGAKGVPTSASEERQRRLRRNRPNAADESALLTIIAVDCGMKENIVRSLVARGAKVVRVPWDYDFTNDEYDGLFISNGPGDPMRAEAAIAHIREAFKKKKPILGICLGSQLLALAAGAKTYKLPYGHRAQNQPALDETGERCYITSQNHGYAVDAKTLPKEWKVWFTNANDGSVEGVRHATLPYRSVQFHPEASPGPTDTAWVFDDFLNDVRKRKKKQP